MKSTRLLYRADGWFFSFWINCGYRYLSDISVDDWRRVDMGPYDSGEIAFRKMQGMFLREKIKLDENNCCLSDGIKRDEEEVRAEATILEYFKRQEARQREIEGIDPRFINAEPGVPIIVKNDDPWWKFWRWL